MVAITATLNGGQEVSTYGGGVNQSLTQSQVTGTSSTSQPGSIGNPFIISMGWSGQGYYVVASGDPLIYITNIATYNQEVQSITTGVSGGLQPGAGISNDLLPSWI